MRELEAHELEMVSGGFWSIIARILIPTFINIFAYSWGKKHNEEEITAQGLAIAAGTGVVSGGVGAFGSVAAGGGFVGNAVWIPSTTAINVSGNLIAEGY